MGPYNTREGVTPLVNKNGPSPRVDEAIGVVIVDSVDKCNQCVCESQEVSDPAAMSGLIRATGVAPPAKDAGGETNFDSEHGVHEFKPSIVSDEVDGQAATVRSNKGKHRVPKAVMGKVKLTLWWVCAVQICPPTTLRTRSPDDVLW